MKFSFEVKSSQNTFLLPREYFKSRRMQVVTSFLMLTVLGIQIYLFISISYFLDQIQTIV